MRIQPGLQGPCEGQQVTSVLIPQLALKPGRTQGTLRCDTAQHRTGKPPTPHQFMMKGFLENHISFTQEGIHGAISLFSAMDPTHLWGLGAPETAANTLRMPLTIRGRQVTHQGQVKGRQRCGQLPKLWGLQDPPYKILPLLPHGWSQQKTDHSKCWWGCGGAGSLMHHW